MLEIEFILEVIDQGGYIGLFLWLLIGMFIFPIPNEVITMTVGFASSKEVLHPIAAFFVMYFGMISAITLSYLLGRFLGSPLMKWLERRKRFSKPLHRSLHLIDRYHALSLSLSYFLPGLRLFVPFLYGISKFSYLKFIVFSYTGALIWLVIVFSIGYLFGEHMDIILTYVEEGLILLGLIAIVVILKKIKKRQKVKRLMNH